MRSVDNTQHQGFAKGSWAATNADLLSFTYLSDPTEVSGRRQRDITNARDRAREQGGDRYSGTYTRVWGGTLLEISANKHNGEVTDLSAIRESRNDVLFQTADVRVLTDEQVGGFGRDLIDERDNKAHPRIAAAHLAQPHHQGRRWSGTAPTTSATRCIVNSTGFTTLADKYRGAGITAAQIAAGGWSGLQFDVSTTSDFNGLIRTIDASADRARVLHGLRRRPQRHGHARPSSAPRWHSATANPGGTACSTIATSRPRPARRKRSRRA